MAEIIPYQPVTFEDNTDACLLNTTGYQSSVILGDNTQFQFLIDGCTSAPDILVDADWVLGTNWTSIGGGVYLHTAGAQGNMSNPVGFTASGYYKIIIVVTSMTAGSLVVKVGLTVKGTITANGTYEFFQQGPVLGSDLVIVASSDCQARVGFASVLLMNKKMKVIIYKASDDSQVAILENADGYFNFNNQYWTTSIDWGALGLSYDCYYIGIADECLNTCSQLYLAGQDFYQESFWVEQPVVATLILLNNVWLYEGTGASSALLTANYAICSGRSYTISYTLAGLAGDAVFQLDLGGTTGALRSANGSYTETIVSGGTSFNMSFASTVNPSNFWISNLVVEGIDSELTSDYVSNRFSYTESVDCTKVITAVCDENSFGMGFVNTGFIPRVRVNSKLMVSSYPQERVKTKTSQGFKRVDFFTGDKSWRLRIIRQPEHILDFLSLLIGFDHWYIDDVEYFAAEDELSEPRSNKFFNLYDLDIECQKKTTLLVNKNCNDNVESGELAAVDMISAQGGRVVSASGIQLVQNSRQ